MDFIEFLTLIWNTIANAISGFIQWLVSLFTGKTPSTTTVDHTPAEVI
jgi:hypothetical protein